MDQSLLARISPEIRNRIYEFAVSEDSAIRIARTPAGQAGLNRRSPSPQGINLTTTCRQIREECTQLFFASNEFEFESDYAMKLFLQKTGTPEARAIFSQPIRRAEKVHFEYAGKLFPEHNSDLRNLLRSIRRIAMGLRLDSAEIIITFHDEVWEAGFEVEVVLDVVDLGASWDREDADLAEALKTEQKQRWKDDIQAVRMAIQGSRSMLEGC